MSLYIAKSGDDTANGTLETPLRTLSQALTNRTNETDIIFLEGSYEVPTTDINVDGLTIKGAENKKIIFDGTKSIDELKEPNANWEKIDHTIATENGNETTTTSIYRIKIKATEEIWQVFNNRKEIINARYPSAQWTNESVYNTENNWGHGFYDKASNNGNNIPYNNGELIDFPTNKVNLYKFIKKVQTINPNFDLTGAVAILNVGSFKTYTKILSGMTLDEPNEKVTFTYSTADLWKTKHHYYYLENKLEFLTTPNEWYFDNANKYLYVRLIGDKNPSTETIRAKTQTYALNITQPNVNVRNINFFGTTLKGNKSNITIANCNFLYPSCYARSLNQINYGDANIDATFESTTLLKGGSNCKIHKCVFKYTDGIAFEMWGGNNTLEDCYFSYIDKTVANLSSVMTSIRLNGASNIVKNNTFYKTGASSTLNSGDEAIIEYNNLSNSGYLQSDGAMIHCMVNQQPNVKIRFNWCYDTVKYGIRFDGDGDGHSGYIHHNVVWNCKGGIMVKGGELNNGTTVGGHFIYNNTVFNSEDQGKNDIIAMNEQPPSNPVPINYGTIVMNNLGERIYGHRSDAIEIASNMYKGNNYSPTNMEDVILSFSNKDFRPKNNAINNQNIINQGDASATTANTYVQNILEYNAAAEVQFNPGSGVDQLTNDIGAMDPSQPIWRAGITWNPQLYSGNQLDTYITSTRLNMYTNQATSTSQPKQFIKYSIKNQKSVLNKMHKKIITRRSLVLIEPTEKNYTMEQNSYGTENRLLRIKSEAINNE